MLTDTLASVLAADPVNPATTEGTANAVVNLLHFLTTDPTGLQILWFGLIAVLWTGYLVLEGFDFGVGMLLPILGKKDSERRAMLSTIGPLWDGNEVWVLTAGGASFAAFPAWYATLFSAAYLPLFLILLGLIARAVAFEYRGKINKASWRKLWDFCIIVGSWIPAVLWGVAFSDLVAGVPAAVDATQVGPSKILYAGDFWDLVIAHNGFALLGGLTTASLFLATGGIFLALKTEGDLRRRAESLAPKLAIVATVLAAVWAVWLAFKFGNNPTIQWITVIVAAVALIGVVLLTLAKKFGLAFGSITVALAAAVATIFVALFPNVINASSVTVKGDAIADPIVGRVVLGTDNDGAGLNVNDVVALTFQAVEATPGADLVGEPTAKTEALTDAILQDVATGTYPAAGLIPQEDVKLVVDKCYERVGGALGSGALTYADIQADPSDFDKAVTAAILADVPALVDGTKTEAIGVIATEHVLTTVAITLARNDLPADNDTVMAVVQGVIDGDDPIADVPAAVVVSELERTVAAALDQIPASVQGVLGKVVETLQAVADAPESETPTLHDGLELLPIITGSAWDNDLGLANLNGRLDNANQALSALVALGLLDEHTDLVAFADGDKITGLPMQAAASSPLTLKLMTIVAGCLVPIVLAYQAWSIWVFRRRISADRIPEFAGLEAAAE
ncbi:MAG: cytochrome d ubiquinol oxidase subunit II [Bifidobacteriaceae bacterium]|jgi:cytochrome d ubiquinol oxidase subunit II|nr:cytochrome d ubiquinol oxidase subunit II [Bifidobacteriaceae bacterium]